MLVGAEEQHARRNASGELGRLVINDLGLRRNCVLGRMANAFGAESVRWFNTFYSGFKFRSAGDLRRVQTWLDNFMGYKASRKKP
jgi:hypothetical protein